MRRELGIISFGLIEIVIGAATLIAVIISLLSGKSAKPSGVAIFVLTSALISLALGIGVLRRNLAAWRLLLFLSAYIILSKVLIFAKIITLSGALETTIPGPLKNIISIIYHSLLVWYFSRASIRREFGQGRQE